MRRISVLSTLLLTGAQVQQSSSFGSIISLPTKTIAPRGLRASQDTDGDSTYLLPSRCETSRRALLQKSSAVWVLGAVTAATTSPALAEVELPKITDKVHFDVRVSRPDGTFYIRGDETDELVRKFSVTVGLFGTAAPNHVERFLSYIRPSEEVLRDDLPFPSYGQSLFKSFDQADGVLYGGTIPSLEVTEFAGSTALKYGGRILPAPLWLEKKGTPTEGTTPLPHSAKGLLIHKKLDAAPIFGITSRSDSGSYVSDFDRDNVAFGVVLDGMEFVDFCAELPTYSTSRPLPEDDSVIQDAAKVVFDAQRDFFRGAAKSLGDTRVSKVFPGKLLRRVEVTRVALL
jgi:hypothetical protein